MSNYTVVIGQDNSCKISLWSTEKAAFNFIKNKFKLPDEANENNYFDFIPNNIYCSIDKLTIDRDYSNENYEGTFHDFQV